MTVKCRKAIIGVVPLLEFMPKSNAEYFLMFINIHISSY